ncbi:eCIS core domain-containing protein [Geodermatophilus amargosae]|uniref:eCIS core domain-containing protein n=1 Tax=Geodermatophilus amargosae TaxID=1296565 RepID=UPI0034E02875
MHAYERRPDRAVSNAAAAPRRTGRPLDGPVRAAMELYFDHDFSTVRVHTDEEAARSAEAVNARAFTVGHDVVFGHRQWAPGTSVGSRLLAHELTHVIQRGGMHDPPSRVSRPGDDAEREAAATANSFAPGADRSPRRIGASAPADVLHREEKPDNTHLERNRFNIVPKGVLAPVGDASPEFQYREGHSNSYTDEAGRRWDLVPDWESVYHQPPGHRETSNPYPNKKLLHKDASGGSSEAIRQPDGTYVTTGPLLGTYNFVHPEGLLGKVGHFFADVVPHEVGGGNYAAFAPPDPARVGDVDTYRQRYEAQVAPIGSRSVVNRTDPYDRQVSIMTGVVWLQFESEEVLALARVRNGQLFFVSFVDAGLADAAIARGTARQPRGIQHIPAAEPHIFGVPTSVSTGAARR